MMFRYKWKHKIIFVQISSETTHVVTATVAVFHDLPHGLLRNVECRSFQKARKMEMVREMEILREMIKSIATSQCDFDFLVANIT
jgi:hypothetical protein